MNRESNFAAAIVRRAVDLAVFVLGVGLALPFVLILAAPFLGQN